MLEIHRNKRYKNVLAFIIGNVLLALATDTINLAGLPEWLEH